MILDSPCTDSVFHLRASHWLQAGTVASAVASTLLSVKMRGHLPDVTAHGAENTQHCLKAGLHAIRRRRPARRLVQLPPAPQLLLASPPACQQSPSALPRSRSQPRSSLKQLRGWPQHPPASQTRVLCPQSACAWQNQSTLSPREQPSRRSSCMPGIRQGLYLDSWVASLSWADAAAHKLLIWDCKKTTDYG